VPRVAAHAGSLLAAGAGRLVSRRLQERDARVAVATVAAGKRPGGG
jgi:hypothetical protein